MSVLQKTILGFSGSFFLFVGDRALKWLAQNFADTEGFFSVFYNDRIAFSLPIEWNQWFSLFVGIILFGLCIVLILYIKRHQFIDASFLLLLILGAFSNLYDRVFLNAVIDYFRVYWGHFNIADVMIALSLCYFSFFRKTIEV